MGSSCKISAAIIPSRNIHYMYVGSTVHTLLCALVFTLKQYTVCKCSCSIHDNELRQQSKKVYSLNCYNIEIQDTTLKTVAKKINEWSRVLNQQLKKMSCRNVVLFFLSAGFHFMQVCCTMGSLHALIFASRNKNQRLFLRYLVMKATEKGLFPSVETFQNSLFLLFILISTFSIWAEGMQFYCHLFPYYTIFTFLAHTAVCEVQCT